MIIKTTIRKILLIFISVMVCMYMCSGYTVLEYLFVKSHYILLISLVILSIYAFTKQKRTSIQYISLVLLVYLLFDFCVSYELHQYTTYIFLKYFCAILLVNIDMDEKYLQIIIRVIKIMSIILVITQIISVFYPQFLSSTLSFLYTDSRIGNILAQQRKGFYIGYVAEKAYAAYLLNIGIVIHLSDMFSSEKKISVKNLFVLLFLLFGIVLTAKRMLLLIAVLIIVFAFLFYQYKQKFVKLSLLSIGALLVIIILFSTVPQMQTMLMRFENMTDDLETMSGRTGLWEAAIDMFLKKPILGQGFGSYTHLVETYNIAYKNYSAHNCYIQLLGETGIVGSFCFLLFFLFGLYNALKRWKYDGLRQTFIPLSILIITFLYSFTGNTLYEVSQTYMLFFAYMILSNLERKMKEQKEVIE